MLAQSSADMTNYSAQLYDEVVFPCESDDATECEPTRDDISDSSTKDTLSQSRDDISDSSMTDTLSQSSDDISDSSRKDTLSHSSDDISDSSMKDTVPQSEACKRQKQADPASLLTHGSICEGETGLYVKGLFPDLVRHFPRSYAKAEQLKNSVHNIERCGKLLRAIVPGQHRAYKVSLSIASRKTSRGALNNQSLKGECECKDHEFRGAIGGFCKHLGALALRVAQLPGSRRDTPGVSNCAGDKRKDPAAIPANAFAEDIASAEFGTPNKSESQDESLGEPAASAEQQPLPPTTFLLQRLGDDTTAVFTSPYALRMAALAGSRKRVNNVPSAT